MLPGIYIFTVQENDLILETNYTGYVAQDIYKHIFTVQENDLILETNYAGYVAQDIYKHIFTVQENDLVLETNYAGYVAWGEYPFAFAACLEQEECYRQLYCPFSYTFSLLPLSPFPLPPFTLHFPTLFSFSLPLFLFLPIFSFPIFSAFLTTLLPFSHYLDSFPPALPSAPLLFILLLPIPSSFSSSGFHYTPFFHSPALSSSSHPLYSPSFSSHQLHLSVPLPFYFSRPFPSTHLSTFFPSICFC